MEVTVQSQPYFYQALTIYSTDLDAIYFARNNNCVQLQLRTRLFRR